MVNCGRIVYVDSMKGIAILLMVMGHVIAWQFPNPNEILNDSPRSAMFLFRFIYSFHMPLLMFCSGLFALHIKDYSLKNVGKAIWKRFLTLIVPFFCAGLIQNIIKPNQLFDYWFLWMLFQFIVVVLLIDWLCSFIPKYGQILSTISIVVISLSVHLFYHKFYFLEHKPLIDVDHWRFFLFFCMGVICARYDLCTKWLSKNWVYSLALLVFGFLTYWCTIMGNYIPKQSITWCLIPISAIVACVYLFKEGLANNQSRSLMWLQDIGRHSLEIYIIHFFFLFRIYPIGEFVLEQANTDGGGRTIFFAQATTSFVASVIIIALCYLVMNIINKSNILSQMLLGRKSEMKNEQ